jgi:hypothetical protein
MSWPVAIAKKGVFSRPCGQLEEMVAPIPRALPNLVSDTEVSMGDVERHHFTAAGTIWFTALDCGGAAHAGTRSSILSYPPPVIVCGVLHPLRS